MTGILRLEDWSDQIAGEFLESKDDPSEWYVLTGSMCGEYSVQAAEMPDEYEEHEQELPPEDRDATENVDGFMQIGMQGWSADAFAEDCNFVGEYAGYGNDKLDTRLLNILVVHEDMLTDEALDIANRDQEVSA